MGIYYVGIFPPKYGGVTIKNKNLYQAISERISVKKIDLNKIKKLNFVESIRLFEVLVNKKNKLMIGIAGQRRLFSKVLYYLNRECMQNSIIFIMGGLAAKEIADDAEYAKYMKHYKKVYVETIGMKKELEKVGLTNVGLYPNARIRPRLSLEPQMGNNNPLKCLFFSLIDETKGADIILDTAARMGNVEFHFYGEIGETFKNVFLNSVDNLDNIFYHGVFKGTDDEVYDELRKYDVILLPTKWKAEGIPGILVEAKIACVPVIVSNINYNSEIVCNAKDGIILEKNDSDHLTSALYKIIRENELLPEMRQECKKASGNYYIETYLEEILSCL